MQMKIFKSLMKDKSLKASSHICYTIESVNDKSIVKNL